MENPSINGCCKGYSTLYCKCCFEVQDGSVASKPNVFVGKRMFFGHSRTSVNSLPLKPTLSRSKKKWESSSTQVAPVSLFFIDQSLVFDNFTYPFTGRFSTVPLTMGKHSWFSRSYTHITIVPCV